MPHTAAACAKATHLPLVDPKDRERERERRGERAREGRKEREEILTTGLSAKRHRDRWWI